MILKFFFIFLGLFQTDLGNQLLEQADEYIDNIANEQQIEYSYWGLSELYFSNCDYKPLKRLISSTNVTIIKQEFSRLDCSTPTKINRENELLKFANKQKLHGLIAVIITGSTDMETRNLGIEYLNELVQSSRIPENDQLFYSKIIAREKVAFENIPPNIRDLVLYSVLFNYTTDTFLMNGIDERFISRHYTEFITSQEKYSIRSAIQFANLIFMLYNANRYNDFLELHRFALINKSFPNTSEKIRHLKAIAFGHYFTGRYDKALEIYRSIIQPIADFYNNKAEIDDAKLAQATNLFSLGKFNEAKIIFEELNNDAFSTVNKAQLLNNLSISYQKLGEKNKYLTYLLDALQEAENDTNYANILTVLNNLYFYYSSIGDNNTALNYLDKARDIATANNDIYQIASINAITGIFYWQVENDVQKALKQLRIASREFNPETDFFDYSRSQHSISEIYIELDSLSRARKVLQVLQNLAAQNSFGNAYIESSIGLLEISLLENNLQEAQLLLDEISLYSLNNLSFKKLVKYNTLLAEFQFQSGEQRLAYQNLRPVIDQILDRARTSIDTQTGYWVQESEYIDAFNGLLNILLTLGYSQETVQLLDEIKTINDAALYNSPILRAKGLSEEDLARDQLLNSQITTLRKSFLHAIDNTTRLAINSEIGQLSAEREEILNKIRRDDSIKKTPIWKIQQKLDIDQEIVHFTEVGDFLYISYMSRNSIDIEILEFKSSEKALFTRVADQIALSKTNLNELFEIYSFLNLESNIHDGIKSLIVVPDNYLYRIPLDILPISTPENPNSYGSTRYMIEEFNLEYFASLQEFHTIYSRASGSFTIDLLAFAISDFSNFDISSLPSLPFAAQEVRAISDKLDAFENKNIYLETEATKTAFLDEVSSAKIVHIATHSEVSEQDPLFSTIYLNDQSTNTDLDALYAYELFEQRLDSELIMLNSCSSGSGDYLQGSGIMGITRALRYAGAKSMALNLWAVNDKVAYEFASVFYESLNSGSSKSQAMRDAKLFLLHNGNANPHFWGAFMLTGDPSPIIKRPDNAGLVFPILLVLVGSLSFYLRRIYSI